MLKLGRRVFVSVFLQDTVIYDRLADSSRYKDITLKHLEQFATEGEQAARHPMSTCIHIHTQSKQAAFRD